MAIPLVLAMLGAGGFYGVQWVAKNTCSGNVTATVVAPPRTAALLRSLATQWSLTKPQVERTCVAVQVRDQETAATVQALTQKWDRDVSGPEPDVWVPPSSAWARAAAATSDVADKLMPDRLPSVARTPVVIAMPKQLAESFGWPKPDLDWKDLLDKLSADGNVKIGMSSPAESTAGLLALSSIIDANDDADVDASEFQRVFTLEQRVAVFKKTTEELLAEYVGGQGQSLNAFPALEQDIVKHNEANPSLPLVAVYPKNATTEADHPFLKLEASWTTPDKQSAATEFLNFVRGDTGRKAVLAEGFRDSNRSPGPQLTQEKGVVPKLTALPRPLLLADSIAKTTTYWNALTRPTNLLLVLDVSGSMRKEVPGVGTRLDLTKAAATQAINLMDKDSQMGLWSFSSGQAGTQPHKELVKPAKLSQGDQRNKLIGEINKLVPGGNTGMYDTIWAAFQAMQANYVPDSENLVVVLTDGADDDQLHGLKLGELTDKLKNADPSKKVKVVTIALGRDGNSDALQEVANATGVRSYSSARSHDISKVLISAIFDVKV
ncbi:substrate-binding and VWA domain-containing protein [Allorhizocola rhizosphaerae]|uniref:substrate-binding and VWA domain-containing protein n=1 Tax=Allorhizocola rhizosphaerae TaxID=1872709 RepID=UPI0013C3513B|nr:substrate-binding and VWA domain-containing protein [Allorhizocola rhizosphaerae]